MGQTIGQSTRDGSAPQSAPYTTRHLMGTVLHTLFDLGALRLESGLPREVTSVTDQSPPIAELF